MLKCKALKRMNNNKGMAIFEMIPIIIVLVIFINFSLGFFGAIHTGILNSISSRNYAFSTFNHRANVTYFRSRGNQANLDAQYSKFGFRMHGTSSEKKSGSDPNWYSTTRSIDFFAGKKAVEKIAEGNNSIHNNDVNTISDSERNVKVGVNPIWVKTTYGICLTASCGG